MPHIDYDEEEVGWLDQLITEYDRDHDHDADVDPAATMEMLLACGRIANLLRAALPEREPQEAAETPADIPL